jgi:hypothetical protein
VQFHGLDQAQAVAVPFYYGCCEVLFLLIYCIGAWKSGWTKAPADIPCWKMMMTSYEIVTVDPELRRSSTDVAEGSCGAVYVAHSDDEGDDNSLTKPSLTDKTTPEIV